MYVQRDIADQVVAALKALPVVVLTGPRQVGKTTLLQEDNRFKKRRYISLDDLTTLNRARSDPEALLEGDEALIIDEAQRAPELFPAIKRAVDRKREKGRFLLSGSANLLLMKSISESLAGRAVYLSMGPLTWRELQGTRKETPRLIRLLNREDPAELFSHEQNPPGNPKEKNWFKGGFPPACLSEDLESNRFWFMGYEQTYLERDLRDLSSVSDLGLFQRFLRLTALRTGQILNMRELARDCGSNPVTVSRWLSLLETGFLVRRIAPWHHNRAIRLMKTPKLYLCDSGLACFLCGIQSGEALDTGPLRGAIAETFIFHNLHALLGAFRPDAQVCHFRSHSGYEVDFVVETSDMLLGIEVKVGGRINPRELKGLESLLNIEPNCLAGITVYAGKEILRLGERLWAVPAGNFLE